MRTLKKKLTLFTPNIRSRHPSHNAIRGVLKKLPFRSVVRLGSTTPLSEIPNSQNRIELNTVEAVKISSNKLLMKQAFDRAGANTAPWREANEISGSTAEKLNFNDRHGHNVSELLYPIVAKAKFGSKGKGNTLIRTQEEFNSWRAGKTLSNYIIEKFMNYGLEYRLHISAEGCFYACRKALKSDCPEDQKWRHHDDTCVWFKEFNDDGTESLNFKKPNSWTNIIDDCVAALNEIGADILAFDVKVQSAQNNKGKQRDFQEYILLESNSAPSFGETTAEMYIKQIPIVLTRKAGNNE